MIKIEKFGSLQGILQQIKLEHLKLKSENKDSKKIVAWKQDDKFCIGFKEESDSTQWEIPWEDDAIKTWWNEFARFNPPNDWNINNYSDIIGLQPTVKE